MNLNEIWTKISDEAEQAAAIADIMCVFSIASGAPGTDLPLESIPNGMAFICDTLETHRKNLSEISELLTNYKKSTDKVNTDDILCKIERLAATIVCTRSYFDEFNEKDKHHSVVYSMLRQAEDMADEIYHIM